MNDLVVQVSLVAGVLAACFLRPALALVFMLRRQRQARAQRRSPIGRNLLRDPGRSLREQLEEAAIDLCFDLAVLMVAPPDWVPAPNWLPRRARDKTSKLLVPRLFLSQR